MTCCPTDGKRASERLNISVRRNVEKSERLIHFPAKRIEIGTSKPIISTDGETRRRAGLVGPFLADPYAITVAEFGRFVEETDYETDAQRYGWSLVFHTHVANSAAKNHNRLEGTPWWIKVHGANWRHWTGQEDDSKARANHPVTHVSWNDAIAYAAWAGGRLPTESEWEYAAGLGEDIRYPWGNIEPEEMQESPLCIFQGQFPNEPIDHVGPVAVDSYGPNESGLYNLVGNAWEWIADPYRIRSIRIAAKLRNTEAKKIGARVLKGGSHLCHKSYCWRFRNAARSSASADTSSAHAGFRVFYDEQN